MMLTATRKVEFDAGHRLVNHESKCKNLHGHRYVAEITCIADELDSIGRVIDFSAIKAQVGGWIDDHWDHATIVSVEDKPLIKYLGQENQKHYIMQSNPTAENMAKYLIKISNILLSPYNIKCHKIKLWETPNCFVEVLNESSIS